MNKHAVSVSGGNVLNTMAELLAGFKSMTADKKQEFIFELRGAGINRPGIRRMADAFQKIADQEKMKRPCQCANTNKATPLNAYHDR